MLEKIKKIFNNKEKRVENLVFFLVVLVITLIIINKITDTEEETKYIRNETNVELAYEEENKKIDSENLEKRLENILSKISGVGKVAVLLTYSESSSIVPIYNINQSTSTIEEKDTSGGTRKTETENNQKDVLKDGNSNIVTEKTITPKVEGAIITAQGANNSITKTNIISAVEAVTGIATHKIQVFEMGE